MDQMLRIRDYRRMRVAFLSLFLVSVLLSAPLLVEAQERKLNFDGKCRVNAHGSEFNALVMSADGQRLFVASEKGHTIVWNIAAGRVEQTLDQSEPIHLIATLAGAQEFVAAGSNHFEPRNAVIRRWDAKTGAYVDLDGVDKSSFPAALSTEPNTGLIALTTLEGVIHVWDATSNRRIATAVSANRRWLAVVDDGRKITVFDLTTLRKRSIASKSRDAGPLDVTDDGRYVYRVAHGGRLLKWDMKSSKFTESVLQQIRDVHSNVDFMTLANDDKWVVVTGNHGDVGIFDRVTGRLLSYTQVRAAASYVERVWIRGDRMISTTDTGVLFDGRLR